MKRTVTAHVKHPDGTEQDMKHESVNDPLSVAHFVTGLADDQPGNEITLTIKSEYEPGDERRYGR